MRNFIAAVLVGVMGTAAGCKSTYESYEGIACSTTEGDDPHRSCSRIEPLVCISTSTLVTPNDTVVPLYECWKPCGPAVGQCDPPDVCCPGPIYGKTFGAAGACVPLQKCDSDRLIILPDGGVMVRDGGTNNGLRKDGSADGGEPDGGAPPDLNSPFDEALEADVAVDSPVANMPPVDAGEGDAP